MLEHFENQIPKVVEQEDIDNKNFMELFPDCEIDDKLYFVFLKMYKPTHKSYIDWIPEKDFNKVLKDFRFVKYTEDECTLQGVPIFEQL